MSLRMITAVAIGGAAGSILRYIISTALLHTNSVFPYATFIVNMVGCLLIGTLTGWLTGHIQSSQWLAPLLVTGFCGGLTTFSTFTLDAHRLLSNGFSLTAIFYQVGSLLAGLLLAHLGLKLGTSI